MQWCLHAGAAAVTANVALMPSQGMTVSEQQTAASTSVPTGER